jgi:hypothetical protein
MIKSVSPARSKDKAQWAPTSSDQAIQSSGLFYDSKPLLTTHGIGQQRGTGTLFLPRKLILSAKSGPCSETLTDVPAGAIWNNRSMTPQL